MLNELNTFELATLRILDDRVQGLASDQGTINSLKSLFRVEASVVNAQENLLSKIAMGPVRFDFFNDSEGCHASSDGNLDRITFWFCVNLGLRLTKYKSLSLSSSHLFQFAKPQQPFADECNESNSLTIEEVKRLYSNTKSDGPQE